MTTVMFKQQSVKYIPSAYSVSTVCTGSTVTSTSNQLKAQNAYI